MEIIVLSQMTISAYGIALSHLVKVADKLGQEDHYWKHVEQGPWDTGLFLLQTAPVRLSNMISTSLGRLRSLTPLSSPSSPSSSSPSSFLSRPLPSLRTIRTALPPSLLLTSSFPHLSATLGHHASSTSSSSSKHLRKLFFLSLSPLMLTRQEVALKRRGIQHQIDDAATQLGKLSLARGTLNGDGEREDEGTTNLRQFLNPNSSPTLKDKKEDPTHALSTLRLSIHATLVLLDATFSPTPTLSPSPSSAPTNPSDLAQALSYFLSHTLPSHSHHCKTHLSHLSRPNVYLRLWPTFVSLPLLAFTLGRTIYSSRATLLQFLSDVHETTRQFLLSWVLDPLKHIIDTVAHSPEELKLMPRESLRTDLESLERMVVDFGRDQGMEAGSLGELGEKVRRGDLSTVLRVWEEDIKSPIKSAVTGNLIRTLLIQVQKVKVDTLVAVTGVEKMLASQQLTFGFVGVAPALLVVYGVGSWGKRVWKGEMRGEKGKREVRRRMWSCLRNLETLLTNPVSTRINTITTTTTTTSSEEEEALNSQARLQGHLIIALSTFRTYAYSREFPLARETEMRDAFVEDVRRLEEGEGGGMEKGVERLWRWARVLRWEELV